MTRLHQNAMPAEIHGRGCSFAERFHSQAEVEANGGTVFGTPTIDFGAVLNGTTDRISYDGFENREWNIANGGSVRVKFKTPDPGQTGYLLGSTKNSSDKWGLVIVNNALRFRYVDAARSVSSSSSLSAGSWHDVVIAYDGSSRPVMILDGAIQSGTSGVTLTDVVGSNMGSNAQGTGLANATIDVVKVFKQDLDQSEAIDFYTHSTYNYRDRASVILPMRAAQHEATKTIDVSNGNNATFYGGITKRANRGYALDGTGYMIIPHDDTLNFGTGDFSISTTFKVNQASNQTFFDKGFGDSSNRLLFSILTGNYQFYVGGMKALYGVSKIGEIKTLTGVRDGDNLYLYLDGELVANSSGAGLIDVSVSTDAYIGSRSVSPTNYINGDLYSFELFDLALTPLQVAYLHQNMMLGINQV
jgi:hypothetical protein